jgi:hypothetical protein
VQPAGALLVTVRVAIVAAALVAPARYWSGGILELEATEFITQYLDDRSAVQKVLDPYTNDLGTYQARELSYFFDYIDAQVFGWLLASDRPVFIPLSAMVAALLTIAVFWRGARDYPLSPVTAGLILLVYSTGFVHLVTMGMFYRSTKPLLAPLVMSATFLVLSALRDRSPGVTPNVKRRAARLVVVVAAMSLLDRQGFFFALLALGTLAFRDFAVKARRGETAAVALSVALMIVYDVAMGPWLVQWANGYWPSLAFQRIPVASLIDWNLTRHAVRVLLIAVSMLFGAVPGWLVVAVFTVAVGVVCHRLRSARTHASAPEGGGGRSWTASKVALLTAAIAVSQVVMFTAMAYRHPPLYEHPDHALWYYPLPLQAFITALCVPLLAALLTDGATMRRIVVNAVLTAIVVGNVGQWQRFERQQRNSHWFNFVYTQTQLLNLSMRDGRPSRLQPGYIEFYEFCLTRSPALRERAERAGSIFGQSFQRLNLPPMNPPPDDTILIDQGFRRESSSP